MLNWLAQNCNWWKATYVTTGSAQTLGPYQFAAQNVPCSVQPANAMMQQFYLARGTVMTLSIFTVQNLGFKRDDILQWYDPNGTEHQFHLVADVINVMYASRYIQLAAEEYPEGAKKLLSLESYG